MPAPSTRTDFARSCDQRPATMRAEARTIRRLLGDCVPGASVLDVPCGNGRLTPYLSWFGNGTRIGVDASIAMVQEARAGLDTAVVADAARLPFPDDSVDLVVCIRLLHHLRGARDRRRILRELARIGRVAVLLSYDSKATLQGLRRRWRPSSRRGVPPAEFRRDLADADLEIIRCRSLLPFVREQTLVLCRAPFTGRS